MRQLRFLRGWCILLVSSSILLTMSPQERVDAQQIYREDDHDKNGLLAREQQTQYRVKEQSITTEISISNATNRMNNWQSDNGSSMDGSKNNNNNSYRERQQQERPADDSNGTNTTTASPSMAPTPTKKKDPSTPAPQPKPTFTPTASPVRGNPCKEAHTCEECDKVSKSSTPVVCIWNDNECQQGTNAKPNMCDPSPISPNDPCKEATTCTACQQSTKKENLGEGNSCIWDGGKSSCTKQLTDQHPEAGDAMCTCENHKNCQECRDASSSLPAGVVCQWNGSVCTIGLGDKPPLCSDPAIPDAGKESESSNTSSLWIVSFAVLITLGVAFYCLRKRRSTVRHSGELPGIKRFHNSAVYQGVSMDDNDRHMGANPHRTTGISDEWGWDDDDGGNERGDDGDIELADKPPVPGMNPFSLSSSSSSYQDHPVKAKMSPAQSKRLVHRSSSKEKESFLGNSSPLSSGASGIASAPKTTTGITVNNWHNTTATMTSPPPPIVQRTSNSMMGSPGTTGGKTVTPPTSAATSIKSLTVTNKKSDDDIFAELGLAAKPTFTRPVVGTTSSSTVSSRTTPSVSTWSTNRTTPSSSLGATHLALKNTDIGGDDAAWGDDDADLDDLLKD